MNKLSVVIQRNSASVERVYRIMFYILCSLILISAVIKIGGALNRTKIGFVDFKIRLDHLLHAVAYLIFSMYYIAGRHFGLTLFKRHSHLLFFLILFLLGFLAETLQIWIPYRSFSLMDLLSNIIGIFAGWVITVFLRKGMTVRWYNGTTV